MKTGILLKKRTGEYYIHQDVYGPMEEAKVFFDLQEARKKAQALSLVMENVEVRYKVLEGI